MPTDTFASFAHRLDQMVSGITGQQLKQVMTQVGVAAKKDAEKAASADLGGDAAFSGWVTKAGDPIKLDTRFDHIGEGRISFHPTRKAAGPWTVAEFGRNTAAGPPMMGPKILKSGKTSKAKQKRWNGRTKGKGTATKALAAIERQTPDRLEAEIKKALHKAFG